MALTANSLVKATGAAAIGDADLTGAVTTSGSTATTLATGLNPDFASVSIAAQKLQTFVLQLTNTAGTIQHRFLNVSASADAAAYADKITGVSASLANTPSVSGAVNFTNGAGLVSGATHIVSLNTGVQSAATYLGVASYVEYYDGNSSVPHVMQCITSRDVNGTTRLRLELNLTINVSGVAWTVDTTRLPAGKVLNIRCTAFLA